MLKIGSAKMLNIFSRQTSRLPALIASKRAFAAIIVLFVMGAAWIAVSGRYPMAYDEGVHLGIVKIYSQQWSPFLSHQPQGADQFGQVVREPSYLYHYLMSFPWRVITHLTKDFMTQVIIMRLINVALFTSGIILMQRLLMRTRISNALINVALLFFVLTPITSQVAAQINYDNLMLPLLVLSLILTLDFVKNLKKGKIDWTRGVLLLSSGFVISIVKYSVLPILAAVMIYVAWVCIRTWRKKKLEFKIGYNKIGSVQKILLALLLVFSFGLFFERYGVNTIRYGTPLPSCEKVLSTQACFASPVWKRNYDYERTKNQADMVGPLKFTYRWGKHMLYNLMFALNGPQSGHGVGMPLFLPQIAVVGLGASGALLTAVFWRRIFASPGIKFLTLVVGFYCGALWYLNYSSYVRLGQLTAVQGRYLLPILVFIYIIAGLAISHALKKVPSLRTGFVSLALICFLAGGGALTFILRSDSSWYWENSTVIQMNENVQKLLKPIIPGS